MVPLVSIIIPVYNSAKHVSEAIHSALNQTWKNIEIILVDDGSTDNSLSIIQSFAAEDVKVFYQANKGASAARNRGLKEAHGEFIQYLDADDLISPNKIELQIQMLEQKKDHICTCSTVHFFENEDPLAIPVAHNWVKQGSADPVDFLIKLYGGDKIGPEFGGMIAVHSWLSPKKVLEAAGAWNEELSMDDDGEYFCRVILASKGISYADDAVCYYRKHITAKSLTASLNEKTYLSMLRAIDLKYKHLRKVFNNTALLNKIFSTFYWTTGVSTYPHFKKISAEAIKKAKTLGYSGKKYHSGPFSNLMVKLFGWRLVRRITYYRYGL